MRQWDRWSGVFLAVLALVFMYMTLGYPTEAAMFPRGILIGILAGCAGLIASSFKGPSPEKEPSPFANFWWRPTIMFFFAVLLVAVLIILRIWYLLSIVLFIFGSCLLLGKFGGKKKIAVKALVVSLLTTLGIAIVFTYILRIPLA